MAPEAERGPQGREFRRGPDPRVVEGDRAREADALSRGTRARSPVRLGRHRKSRQLHHLDRARAFPRNSTRIIYVRSPLPVAQWWASRRERYIRSELVYVSYLNVSNDSIVHAEFTIADGIV